MLVKATSASARLGVKIKEVHRIVAEGEYFEVSPMRFKILSGENRYKAKFVIPVEEVFEREPEPVIEETIPEPVIEEVVEEAAREEVVEEPIIEVEEHIEEEQKPKKRSRKKTKAE